MEKEIKFKDIRVGDTIRTVKFVCDLKISYEGVVAKLTADFANTAEAVSIARAGWDECTYVLLSRPAPPLPTEPESVITATKVRGVEGKWRLLLHEDGYWVSSGPIKGYNFHPRMHVEEWRPTEVFEVTP